MPEESAFLIWFSKLRASNKLGVVCPDAMSFIRDSSQAFPDRAEWIPAVSKLQVSSLNLKPVLTDSLPIIQAHLIPGWLYTLFSSLGNESLRMKYYTNGL